MGWQFTPYLIPLLGAVIVLSVLTIYATLRVIRDRITTGIAAVIIFLIATIHWNLSYTYQLANTGPVKALWSQVASFGLFIVPLAWFAFVVDSTNRVEWLRPTRFGPLVGISVVGVILHLTNPIHEVLWSTPETIVYNGSFLVLTPSFTGAYYLLLGFLGAVTVGGAYVLLAESRTAEPEYKRWTLVLLASIVVPVIAGIKFYAGIGPHPNVNLLPLGFAVTGIVLSVAVLRYQFLDVLPVTQTTVMEVMNEGLLVLDSSGMIERTNPAARDCLDITEDALGQPAVEVLPEAKRRFADHAETDDFQWTAQIEQEDTTRHVRIQVSPLVGDRFLGRIVLVRDVSERHTIEKRYQALIESSSDVILIVDETGTITYASPSIERILGKTPDAVEGEGVFSAFPSDGDSRLENEFQRAIDEPGYTDRFEHHFLDADGEKHVFEVVGRNMLDNPYVQGVVLVSREITERKEQEEELKEMNERLEEFASLLTHDLRNPLDVAQIHLTLARRGNDDALDTVEQAHERIDQLIDGIRALVREGEDAEDRKTVELEALVNEAWSNVLTKGATLEITESTELFADPTRALQLFENLFRNAIEHGGESVTVRVGCLDDGFYVEDDGPGIPTDERESVFNQGYSSTDGGTGLGLSIVERVADAHGWTVSLTDGRDGGARFVFRGVEQSTDHVETDQ